MATILLVYHALRQFIERFDVTLVALPDEPPPWLSIELELQEDELAHEAEKDDRFYYYSRKHCPLTSDTVGAEVQAGTAAKEDED